MLSDSLLPLTNLILPEVLASYFGLKKHEIKGEELHLYFTEQNIAPMGIVVRSFIPKFFFPETTVQDFPIRGKNVFCKS